MRLATRRWRRSRPFWGGLWTLLGGLLILYGPLTAVKFVLVLPQTVGLGIAVGVLIIVFALFLWFAPYLRQIVGVLIVLLAIASFITSDFGGFLIGMILAMIGGALGFAWVPVEPRIQKFRVRRILHLPLPAIQPDLELRGITEVTPVPASSHEPHAAAEANAVESVGVEAAQETR